MSIEESHRMQQTKHSNKTNKNETISPNKSCNNNNNQSKNFWSWRHTKVITNQINFDENTYLNKSPENVFMIFFLKLQLSVKHIFTMRSWIWRQSFLFKLISLNCWIKLKLLKQKTENTLIYSSKNDTSNLIPSIL